MADPILETITITPRPASPTSPGARRFFFGDPIEFDIPTFVDDAATRGTQLANVTIEDVIDVADDGADAIRRGEQALANTYVSRLLDTFVGEATDAAETALRAGTPPAEVARQLAEREVLDGVSFGGTRAVEAVNAAIARLDTAVVAPIARALPEAVVTGSRVLTGTPLGLASLIVEGGVGIAGYLSDLALRRYLDRLAEPSGGPPPPVAPAPTDEFDPENPLLQPEVTVPGRRPPAPAPVTTTPPQFVSPTFDPISGPIDLASPITPGMPSSPTGDAPLTLATPLLPDPVFFTPPAPTSSPPEEFTLAPPVPIPTPTPTSSPTPTLNPLAPNFPGPTNPTNSRNCDCPPKRTQKRPKKPRDVCYRGEYVERSRGLIKFRKRKIPCQ